MASTGPALRSLAWEPSDNNVRREPTNARVRVPYLRLLQVTSKILMMIEPTAAPDELRSPAPSLLTLLGQCALLLLIIASALWMLVSSALLAFANDAYTPGNCPAQTLTMPIDTMPAEATATSSNGLASP